MNLQIQYLTDSRGHKTAVQIPYAQWRRLLADYNHLTQYAKLKRGLEEAFEEIAEIENGSREPITLDAFLDEC